MTPGRKPLFVRHQGNPILRARDWPYPVNSVFNAGATLLPDGSTLLLCRVEDFRGHSHLTSARSANGIDGWVVDGAPTLAPDLPAHPEEAWGVEDPRITFLPELGRYAVTYTSFAGGGPGVSLAMTTDFRTFERLGAIMPPEDKDAALFPHRIGGHWALLHRPIAPDGAHVRISYSPDFIHWGRHRIVLPARQGAWWDAGKIGLSPPPLETVRGWLVMYHGVRMNAAGCLYRVGLALMDRENPELCLLRGEEWVFGPEEEYEIQGDVGKVVFPCGWTLAPDGDTLRIYYGAADSSVALASASLAAVLRWLDANGRPPVEPR